MRTPSGRWRRRRGQTASSVEETGHDHVAAVAPAKAAINQIGYQSHFEVVWPNAHTLDQKRD
jgi:hypothetical protein